MFSLINILNKTANITKLFTTPSSAIIRAAALKTKKAPRDLFINENKGFTFFVDNNKNVVKAKDISEIKPLLLQQPVDYPQQNLISGYMSLSQQEKASLDNPFELELNMTIMMKVLHIGYCLKDDSNSGNDFDNFHTKIYNSFKSINAASFTGKSKIVSIFNNYKMITLTQHLLNITVPNKIPVHILYRIGKSYGIKIDSYVKEETTRIGPHIELAVVNELVVLLKTCTSKEIEVHLVNSENIMGVKENFSPVISEIHTSQKHADSLIKVVPDSYKMYIDVKAFAAVGISHRRLSLFHPSEKKLKEFINDIKCSLKTYLIKNNIKNDHDFWQFYEDVINIVKTNDTVKVKYDNIITFLCKAALDPTYEDLPICIALPIEADDAFNQLLANIPQKALEEVASQTKNEIRVIMDQISSLEDKDAAFCTIKNVLKESLPSYLTHEFFEKAITL